MEGLWRARRARATSRATAESGVCSTPLIRARCPLLMGNAHNQRCLQRLAQLSLCRTVPRLHHCRQRQRVVMDKWDDSGRQRPHTRALEAVRATTWHGYGNLSPANKASKEPPRRSREQCAECKRDPAGNSRDREWCCLTQTVLMRRQLVAQLTVRLPLGIARRRALASPTSRNCRLYRLPFCLGRSHCAGSCPDEDRREQPGGTGPTYQTDAHSALVISRSAAVGRDERPDTSHLEKKKGLCQGQGEDMSPASQCTADRRRRRWHRLESHPPMAAAAVGGQRCGELHSRRRVVRTTSGVGAGHGCNRLHSCSNQISADESTGSHFDRGLRCRNSSTSLVPEIGHLILESRQRPSDDSRIVQHDKLSRFEAQLFTLYTGLADRTS